MQYNLKEIQNSLTFEQIIKLMKYLGATSYIQTNEYLIFPTICHHVSEDEGSMKLYYYQNTHLFTCFTECGASFNIYTLFEKVYKIKGIQYTFTDIINTIVNIANVKNDRIFFDSAPKYK